jgi:hypothetical protein
MDDNSLNWYFKGKQKLDTVLLHGRPEMYCITGCLIFFSSS